MKNEINPDIVLPDNQNKKAADEPVKNSQISRRKFVGMAGTAAVGFTIVPRYVLGGKYFVAPSDKITLAYIGTGTQGIRELLPLLANEQFHVTAVCDPNKEAV
ncbi:MAG: twin-arginine translocation signal domain-containing protein, partial [Chitinophagaceae bacterium]